MPKPIDAHNLDICLKKWLAGDKKDVAMSAGSFIDIEDGIARFGSEEKFKKVLLSFKRNIPAMLKELEENSGEEYIISIHNLKGCARTIFMDEIGDRAQELEIAAKKGDWKFVESKNFALIEDVRKIVDAIKIV